MHGVGFADQHAERSRLAELGKLPPKPLAKPGQQAFEGATGQKRLELTSLTLLPETPPADQSFAQ
jgi:hypothetical protein